jgi:hypothetical protein
MYKYLDAPLQTFTLQKDPSWLVGLLVLFGLGLGFTMGWVGLGWMDGWMDGQTVEWLVGWVDGQLERWMVGQSVRWVSGWMDGWMGGWSVNYGYGCLR